MAKSAVLLMAFGAADSLAEIPAYLANIISPRKPSEALIAQVTERYKSMGGASPLKKITAAQAAGLQQRLGDLASVYVGMRHSGPWIKDAVVQLRRDGCEKILGIPLTPFLSEYTVDSYAKPLRAALQETGGDMPVREVYGWHDHAALIGAYCQRIEDVLGGRRAETTLLLTAHSLPERLVGADDPYPTQLKKTAELIAERIQPAAWEFAYQSAAGGGREPWLGPEAGEVIDRLAAEGCRNILLSPIGFVSEHMETLYDDDILYRRRAEKLGMTFARAAALNDHPGLIEALEDHARAGLAML